VVDIYRAGLSVALAVFFAVVLGTLAIALGWEWLQQQRRTTVVRRQLATLEDKSATRAGELLRGVQRSSALDPIVNIAHRLGWGGPIERMLTHAGVKWGVGTFLILTLGGALGLALFVLLLTGIVPLALLAGILGGAAPYAFVRHKKEQRLNRFEEALPESLDLLARAIRAGHPIASGIKLVSDEAPEPVAGEFQRTFEEQRFGLPFDDAMLSMADRVPLVDLRMLVTAVLIQREVGGNLAEVLDNLADVIRQRFTVRRQLRTYTAQGRMSGYILAALPIVIGGLIFAMNPTYVRVLFENPVGSLLLTVAIAMQLAGFFWIRHIVDIEF
jgi:tight adherence protein B